MNSFADPPAGKIGMVQFGIFTDLEWLKISVVEIQKPSSKITEVSNPEKEDKSGHRTRTRQNTPYDERMGVLEDGKRCITCNEETLLCPGHFGHIVLPFPIYSLQFLPVIVKVLQCICPHCARPRIIPEHAKLKGLLKYRKRARLNNLSKESVKVFFCPWIDCQKVLPQFDLSESKTGIKTFFMKKGSLQELKRNSLDFNESECLNILRRISNEHTSFLGFNDDLSQDEKFKDANLFVSDYMFHVHQFRPESMIFTILPVIPPISRPYTVRDGKKSDDDLTDGYNSIIKKCNQITGKTGKKVAKKSRKKQKLVETLKLYIWTLFDNTKEGCKLSNGGRPHKCIKQRVKGKDGRVQGNVNGKRVDQSARSVITPGGIYLKADEVGVPPIISNELTSNEYVRRENIYSIQKLVKDGQVRRVKRGNDVIRLDSIVYKNKDFRLQIGDIAERCLKDGDYFDEIIFNRQPSLRIESMIGLRVKILPGYSFRHSLCLTTAYNSDFDGDNDLFQKYMVI